MIPFLRLSAAIAAFAFAAPAAAAPLPADPLNSPMWTYQAGQIFGSDPVRFDPRVRVIMPQIAENQHEFPVAVDARTIPGVKRMILFADLNPITLSFDYRPVDADAYIATRIKLDQRTPVRGAVQLASGEWLVGGGWVDAAGGGCSAPPVSRVKGDWAQHLGEIRGEAWPAELAGSAKLRLLFRHPMDTGLVENIATYHLDKIDVKDGAGKLLATLEVQASVSEDPAFTILPHAPVGATLVTDGRDTNGISYHAEVKVGARAGGAAGAAGAK